MSQPRIFSLQSLILTSLRQNPELLSQVKEQLFKLWGDLEERKSEAMRSQLKHNNSIPLSSLASDISVTTAPRKADEMPDVDSDVENEPSYSKSAQKNSNTSALKERDANISMSGIVTGKADKSHGNLTPKNKAFTCCIKQYGVKVDEEDRKKADAGDGKRWQRVFGLFETYIV